MAGTPNPAPAPPAPDGFDIVIGNPAVSPAGIMRLAAPGPSGSPQVSINGAAYSALAGFASGTDEAALTARSASIMGGAAWAYQFDDLLLNSLATNWSVAGTWANNSTKGVGVWTATSASPAVLSRTGGTPILVAQPNVTPWHIACRMLHVAALQANDQKGVCNGTIVPNTNGCGAGIRQGVSATKYVFWTEKAGVLVSALSTVSIDTTNFHKIELWFDGTSLFGSVDNETPVLVTSAANIAATVMGERHGVEVGTGVGVDQFFDYFYAAGARTPTGG